MAKKKHILTKKTAPKAVKKHRGRQPGSKNKPKAVPFAEASFAILSSMPPREKLKRVDEIKSSLEEEEKHLIESYMKTPMIERPTVLNKLVNINKELGIMILYAEMLDPDKKTKR